MRDEATGSTGCASRAPRASSALYVLAFLVASIAFATALSGCGGSSSGTGGGSEGTSEGSAGTASGTPKPGGTLNIDTPLPIESLNQFKLPPTADTVLTAVFNTLVEPKPGTTEVEPALAESWKVSNNHKTYTFKLRSGVKFSNGDPLTSADVVYSLEQWKEYMLEMSPACCKYLTKVSAPSEGTVNVEFSQPAPNLLQQLASRAVNGTAGIMNAKVREEVGAEAYAKEPIGTGPFKVTSFRTGEAKLVRNPLYWKKGLPYLDAINVRTVEDPNTRILSVKSGETQIATGIPYDQTTALENDPSSSLLVQDPWAAVYTVFINSSKPPLSETSVRRALSYATDRETILANALNGLGSIANSSAVPFGSYDESVEQLPYDLEAAEMELGKSSSANGFPLEIMLQSGDTSGNVTAAILQDSLGKIGIDATIHKVDSGTFISDFVAGKYDLAVGPFDWWPAEEPGPDEQFMALYDSPGSYNTFTWYKNPEATKLVNELIVTTDDAKRLELATEIQKISIEDPSILAVAFETNVSLAAKEVCNFHMRPVGRIIGNPDEVYLSSEC